MLADTVRCGPDGASQAVAPVARPPHSADLAAPDPVDPSAPVDAVVVTYRLTGKANQDTFPPGGDLSGISDAEARSGRLHIGTDITLMVLAHATRLDDPLLDDDSIVTTKSLPGGTVARVTVSRGGLGPMRVEWLYRGRSYTLVSARGTTADGSSGPTIEDLTAMAASTT